MCFSPQASLTGGVIIVAIGIATIRKVHKPSQIVFASIPLFFGFQQIIEGFLWLALQNYEFAVLQKPVTYLFLLMAQFFWPMMIPFAILKMEVNQKRKKILRVLLGAGVALSLYYLLCLILFRVSPKIMGYHIEYIDNFPNSLRLFAFAIYLITSIAPLFISTIKRMYLLGILMALSCGVTIIFFTQYLTSVWCFFAAIISLVILWILRDARRKYLFSR